jgi:hypothetical protein
MIPAIIGGWFGIATDLPTSDRLLLITKGEAVPQSRLFTIGHSNHEFARFVELLRNAGVTAVADVRSQPFSQRYPQFNRAELRSGLADAEIAYAFLGDELGGRPRDSTLYDMEGRVRYERVRQTTFFQKGLDRLETALDSFSVALLCSEEDPIVCHRGLMIAPALVERKLLPNHLRGDNSVETTEDFEARLLVETKVGLGILDGLFTEVIGSDERQRLLEEAYRVQAGRKAFRLRTEGANDSQAGDGEEEWPQ